ncbi:D-amino acid dehydrogenase [Hyphomonas sp.]|uniref:D-amino acid dehydrogenase n=1 Tax=Hyphomonas sp. TaxID=87 RepID=UPI003242682F
MKIAILGGGVIGVTTAYYLARSGHEVTVVERREGPGRETSFANAGQVSAGYAAPWAAPGVPLKALKWLFQEHAPLVVRPQADLRMLVWLARMLANCTNSKYATNKARMVRLAEYSRDQLSALRAEVGLEYDQRTAGTLQLFRSQKQYDEAAKDIEVLQKWGVRYELLEKRACLSAEPGLAYSCADIVGGLRLPGDETGDCFKFTDAIYQAAKSFGTDFRFGQTVCSLEGDRHGITGARTSLGVVNADAFIVALGSFSPFLLRNFGIRPPIYPVKGYSLTADIVDEDRAPVSTVMDETYKVAITRLGNRIRIGGIAELSGFKTSLPADRRSTLEQSARSLFPEAGDFTSASFWTGLRPMTPDGTPIIGATHIPNLYLNTGHGTLGWTMACGSAQVISSQIAGRNPDIDASDLSITRYQSCAVSAWYRR